MWEKLFVDSKSVDSSLIAVKAKFREITLQQIKEFGEELQEFYNRFCMEGPGAVAHDLDKGKF